LSQNYENWLSLKIESNYVVNDFGRYFGELNAHKKAQGRGIFIKPNGNTLIAYFNNGNYAPGNYI
jgi:hypothetical protein